MRGIKMTHKNKEAKALLKELDRKIANKNRTLDWSITVFSWAALNILIIYFSPQLTEGAVTGLIITNLFTFISFFVIVTVYHLERGDIK